MSAIMDALKKAQQLGSKQPKGTPFSSYVGGGRKKKDYRKSYRVFLILFLLSLGINLFTLPPYLKEKKDTLSSISSSILSAFLKKVKETPKTEPVQKIQVAKETAPVVPFPFVSTKSQEYSLLCEKNIKTLHLYRSDEGRLLRVKSFPCLVGLNNGDKREEGDLATPEGIYFLTSFLTGKNLPEKYGYGAYSVNYPNFLDRREGKKGSGIWLHGFPDQMERPSSSEGCVVVRNEVLRELAGFIRVGETPLVIVDSIKYQPLEDQKKVSQDLSNFLIDWASTWEKRDTDKYLRFYSKDFVSSTGLNYQKFSEYKHRVNSSKKFIRLRIEKKSFLLCQKNSGRISILRFNQDYQSDNFKSSSPKILYLQEEQGNWKIIGEISL